MMRRMISTLAAVLALAATVPHTAAYAQATDELMEFSTEDARMNAAVAEARRTLPVFWRRYDNGDGTSFSLKAHFEAPNGGREHLWFSNIKRDGARLTGVLDNDPSWVTSLSRGQTVTFTEDQISDWTYEKGGRMWGGFTLRVMLARLQPTEAAELRAYLSPTPLEGDI